MKKLFILPVVTLSLLLVVQVHAQAADSLAALVQVLNASNDTQLQLDVLRGMSEAMEGRARVPMPAGWDQAEPVLTRSSNDEIRSLAQTLGLKFGSATALASLKATLKNTSAPVGDRREALKALASIKDPELPSILQSLVKDPAISGEVIRGLAGFNDDETPGAILTAYNSLDDTAKRDAVNTLASRKSYARQLMAAVEQGTVPKQALTADLLRQLRNLHDDQVNASIEKVWGAFRESSADKKKQIEKYKGIYYAGGSSPGNASRGRAIFNRTCFQCHTLYGVGGKVGPDLTGSNRGDLDYILQNVVDPNAVIPNEYRTSTIEMKDDRVITGIVKSQDNNALTVATANEMLVLPRKDIAEVQQSELSMMPEGLLDNLQEQEIRDLIYYLRLPNQAPLPTE
ncbi:c-type cytochrome [bacterium]|nr:c-type cytochrome [bacterium]